MQKITLFLGAIGVALSLGAGAASALPVDTSLAVKSAAQPEQVRLVCNRWGRCWHVYGGGGWHGGWHHRHWHRW